MCVCACVRACMRVCVCVCLCACVRACVRLSNDVKKVRRCSPYSCCVSLQSAQGRWLGAAVHISIAISPPFVASVTLKALTTILLAPGKAERGRISTATRTRREHTLSAACWWLRLSWNHTIRLVTQFSQRTHWWVTRRLLTDDAMEIQFGLRPLDRAADHAYCHKLKTSWLMVLSRSRYSSGCWSGNWGNLAKDAFVKWTKRIDPRVPAVPSGP